MRMFQRFALIGLVLLATVPAPAQDDLRATILAKERQELECLRTGNLTEFASLLADDAVFVDSHGPAGKAEVVKNTAEFRLQDFSMEDIRFVPALEPVWRSHLQGHRGRDHAWKAILGHGPHLGDLGRAGWPMALCVQSRVCRSQAISSGGPMISDQIIASISARASDLPWPLIRAPQITCFAASAAAAEAKSSSARA